MTLRPYVAFDMETTGANPDKCEILEMAAVFDDGVSPIEELKTFNIIVRPTLGFFEYSEPFAMQMKTNQEILNAITKGEGFEERDAFREFARWLNSVLPVDHSLRYSFAGKNYAVFDGPIMKRRIRHCGADGMIDVLKRFGYRSIDIGSLFFPEFGYVPDSKELKQIVRASSSVVAHRALADAIDVVHTVRARMES